MRAADERDCLAAVHRLADDFELSGRLERVSDAIEDEPVVIGEEDARLETFRCSHHGVKSAETPD